MTQGQSGPGPDAVSRHLAELGAWAASSGATDVPVTYRDLARAATVRALAAGLLDEAAAQRLLDTLEGL